MAELETRLRVEGIRSPMEALRRHEPERIAARSLLASCACLLAAGLRSGVRQKVAMTDARLLGATANV
jgi:hypothetical protein